MQTVAGLVDAHVHVKHRAGLDCARNAGIIAVRDAGMRENAEKGDCTINCLTGRPVIVASCWALYKPGGYGARFGIPVAAKSGIKSELARLKKCGAGIIKVMASGIVSFEKPRTVTAGGFNGEELRFIVQEASMLGLGVMAHANAEPAIIAAAAGGVRSIEHGFFMTDRALELMAAKGVFWTPTVGALVRSAETAKGKIPGFISELVGEHLQKLKHAYDLGVPLAVGTDCMLPDASYRSAYESELSYFEQAGIARSEVVKIASEGGARLLGVDPVTCNPPARDGAEPEAG